MTDNLPLVSVKTITYNHEKYIRQCIEGVLSQKTNFKFEYIISDDCSTDETREIVKEYAEKYPDIIKDISSDENLGARENGIKIRAACRGKYQASCEGDDYWTDPYKLQKQINVLEKNNTLSFCFHDTSVLSNDKIVKTKTFFNSGIVSSKQIVLGGGSFVPTASIVAKSSFLKEFPDWFVARGGDYFFVLLLNYYGKVYFLKENMSVYRFEVENNSWSSSFLNSKAFQKRLQHHKKMIEGLKAYNEWSNYKFDKHIKKKINKSRKSILSDQYDEKFKKDEYQDWYNELNTLDKIDLLLIKKLPFVKKVLNKLHKTKRYYFG